MARLRVTGGPMAGQAIEVTGELVIGRENAGLTIDDPEMSRRHAVVRLIAGRIEVEDLGSSNGTFVDGERIAGPTRVNGGGSIRCGTTVLEVQGVVPAPKTRLSTAAGANPAIAGQPIADPQVTRATPIADPQVTRATPIADPQATQARRIADPEATRARPIADPQATRARPIADPQATQARSVHRPGAPAPEAPGGGPTAKLSAPVGTFSPPQRRRTRGLASRSWVPAVASFGTVIVVAVALVIYFATR